MPQYSQDTFKARIRWEIVSFCFILDRRGQLSIRSKFVVCKTLGPHSLLLILQSGFLKLLFILKSRFQECKTWSLWVWWEILILQLSFLKVLSALQVTFYLVLIPKINKSYILFWWLFGFYRLDFFVLLRQLIL